MYTTGLFIGGAIEVSTAFVFVCIPFFVYTAGLTVQLLLLLQIC